ncbi:S41 family peptidase [Chryseobacterium phocaeense]|uniref:S41 family peptidase n=1 Tax=Chryseobacterium phocaeense TaxID=1816690 RepID=UPI0009BBA246|nr:S41 family peptidase [Chryseobacterium phocaeense]
MNALVKNLILLLLLFRSIFGYSQNHFAFLEKKVDTLYYSNSGYVNYHIPSVDDFNINGGTLNLLNQNTLVLNRSKKTSPLPGKKPNIRFQLLSKNIKQISLLDATTKAVLWSISPKDGLTEIEAPFEDIGTIQAEVIKNGDGNAVCEIKNVFLGYTSINKREFTPNTVSGKSLGIPYDSYGLYAYYPGFDKEEDNKGTLYFGIKNNPGSLYKDLDHLTAVIEKNYPFYSGRTVNKEILKPKDTTKSVCSYVSELNTYFRQKFNDPHFSVKDNECPVKKKNTPVFVYKIGREYKISGILDDSLSQKINLGETLVAIDGIHLKKISDEKVNELLAKIPENRTELEIEDVNGKRKKIDYSHHTAYKIPSNFIQKTEFSSIGDEVAYMKIRHIDKEALYELIAHKEELKNKKKLILDLRNNGGGDFLIGAQILSLFIKNEFSYYQLKDKFSDKTDQVIVSDKKLALETSPPLEIRVLVNKNTSCVAELIAYNLKKYSKNTKIIGIENTAGALSVLYEVFLEKNRNIKFRTNAFSRSIIMLDGKSIEGKGIQPDIHVNIKNVKDLQPYDDKVLMTAISK